MKKLGRPKKEIDIDQFEKLCGLQCTLSEIAAFFGCSEDTIERFCKREYKRTFAEVFAIKRGIGKIGLRRTQFRLAEKSAAMAIFLGKQYLGQKEVTEYEDKEALERLDEILHEVKQYAQSEAK